tara:strand:- start:10202 stop:10627 length:426 start_codon:yes stop_codon:yes gene_type:complete
MKKIIIITTFLLIVCCKQKSESPVVSEQSFTSSKVFFKNLNDGDTVVSPVVVEMGVTSMKIKPAGALEVGTGHHHIIVDGGFINYGEIIPMDETHLHYGKGDSVAQVNLSKGEHTLSLQFANGLHMSYGEQFSKTITVFVK